ncbi:MAG TPA: redoxin family protein [Pyrinomonadaceae bacterium]|jgi:hypothetical protein|nr:redoxin family protein [Pyrinomonadaceae bacterium]
MDNTLFWVTYLALWLIVTVLFAAVFFLYRFNGQMMLNSRDGRDQQGPEVGKPLPAARLTTVEGKHFDLGSSDLRPQLVFLAATNCKPCLRLKVGFAAFAEKYNSVVDTILVCRGSQEGVAKFASDLPASVIVVADLRWDLGTRLRVHSTPFVFIADSKGIVRGKGNPKDGLALDLFMEQLTEQPKNIQLFVSKSA